MTSIEEENDNSWKKDMHSLNQKLNRISEDEDNQNKFNFLQHIKDQSNGFVMENNFNLLENYQ